MLHICILSGLRIFFLFDMQSSLTDYEQYTLGTLAKEYNISPNLYRHTLNESFSVCRY